MHLGHILSSDLSDNLDIIAVKQGMCRKANHMLTIFMPCDSYTKTKLMQSFCLSLYGASLWKAYSPEMRSLETAYNNLLRRIWSLPRCCHTAILHRVAGVSSIYNMIITRCKKLVASARRVGSQLLRDVSSEASTLVYSNVGYNSYYMLNSIGKNTVTVMSSVPTLFGMPECIQNLIMKFMMKLLICAVPN